MANRTTARQTPLREHEVPGRVADYGSLVGAISAVHTQSQRRAAQAVNVSLTLRNWLIGYHLVEYEQHGSDRAEYGERLLDMLARDLRKCLGRGFGRRNLFLFRGFYLQYPIVQSVIAQSGVVLPSPPSVQPKPLDWQDEAYFARLFQALTWTHLMELTRLDDPLKRAFYEVRADVAKCAVTRSTTLTILMLVPYLARTAVVAAPREKESVPLGRELSNPRDAVQGKRFPPRQPFPELSDFLGAVNVGGPDWRRYGLGWCRHDFSWGALEPENDRFEWEKYDRLIEDAHRHGVQILPILDYTAPWAASKEGDGVSPPKNVTDWEDFVEHVVARYSQPPFSLRYFQVWNEPTVKTGFWHGESDDEFFEKVYLPAAKILKRNDCQVVFGGWPCSDSIEHFCELLDKHEAWRWTDILDVHYFELSAWQALYDRYVKPGKCRGIWQTEIGYHPFPGYLPNCYLRALHFGLRTGWNFRDQYKLFWYAFWGAGPDAPKCLTSNGPDGQRVPSEHGKRLLVLNQVLGGGALAAFSDFAAEPALPPALQEEVPTVLGFHVGDRRTVIALLLDAATRQQHPTVRLDLRLPRTPRQVTLITAAGKRRELPAQQRDGHALVGVPIGEVPLELARNWGKRWEVATAYVVFE
ncbi:MAG: hypothetical protein COZ06_21050 [Armatimonadetes bacterium CG_4_10_14_3_um_filter_66_18]|nr:MAG: hypothetical protein COS65_19080 [Armatimonadetes bacterium CG06_land_8_20_14_3_00_66_21]PIX46578.1 MAG: hypothetical protein COZ57_11315 [Armatimonadetes bacterium CG_4_8_14_3_um_filter_66_20]PIY44225.1 MAG: hypothetical protein COZ06_21050 [Armatimonadetes bacterium CG_4_10_14_3_um_filter_66_18]PIZ44250.1 MAG: hypothetical protein COY42_14400 [Armatimonadetes bacterium CG_4_10_14_0_8_um_filter_66_14]PJB75705.1 MAG: hypothetical protein CO096_01610 [Armatimonadetes bacterium CG_4_9_14_